MKILVVEDDPHTRSGIEDALRNEGYLVLSAKNGREGLEIFLRQGPDMVCMDIMMPEMDGYSLCRAIREGGRGKRRDIPIIFISAKGTEIDKVVGLELGADDFIVKPFGVRELVARIRSVARRCLAGLPAEAASGIAGVKPEKDGNGSPGSGMTLGDPFSIGDIEVLPDELRLIFYSSL